MIVTNENLQSIVEYLSQPGTYAVDTETTGLNPYGSDHLFSIIVANETQAFYFNFQEYQGVDPKYFLENPRYLKPIFAQEKSLFGMHNAKFDLAMLAKDNLEVKGEIHDTAVVARMLFNQHRSYSLADCCKRMGSEKSKAVDEYIAKHKLYTEYTTPEGKKQKHPHFDRVPWEIITAYGMQDGRITMDLMLHQQEKMREQRRMTPAGYTHTILDLYENEKRLIPAVLQMESNGIKIDRDYCERAFKHEMVKADRAKARFEAISGHPLKDSGKGLATAFDAVGEAYPKTEKGNASFTAKVLEGFTTPLAQLLLDYRRSLKVASTYYANFLKLADANDRIHGNVRLAGTATMRFSMSDPNLQNLKKEYGEIAPGEFAVRKAFIPSGPDYYLVMIDYQAMEFRLMLDLAGELGVIEKILNDGLDVHQATADKMGVDRTSAKTLNFMLIYGGGVAKLAASLGVSIDKARLMKREYFSALPRVAGLTQAIVAKAKDQHYIQSGDGFRFHFEDPNLAYKAPNHRIQGGCAQIVRRSIPQIHDLLIGTRSKMLLQVHDELIFDMHKDELDLIAPIQKIMERAYVHKHLPMVCEVSHSAVSWQDKVEGCPV